MFKKRYTKWIPIQIYNFSGDKFLLMGRMNLKSGMLYFKVKRLNRLIDHNHNMPVNIFDPSEQFEKLLNPTNP